MEQSNDVAENWWMDEIQLMIEEFVFRKSSAELQVRYLVTSQQIERIRREQPQYKEQKERCNPS